MSCRSHSSADRQVCCPCPASLLTLSSRWSWFGARWLASGEGVAPSAKPFLRSLDVGSSGWLSGAGIFGNCYNSYRSWRGRLWNQALMVPWTAFQASKDLSCGRETANSSKLLEASSTIDFRWLSSFTWCLSFLQISATTSDLLCCHHFCSLETRHSTFPESTWISVHILQLYSQA